MDTMPALGGLWPPLDKKHMRGVERRRCKVVSGCLALLDWGEERSSLVQGGSRARELFERGATLPRLIPGARKPLHFASIRPCPNQVVLVVRWLWSVRLLQMELLSGNQCQRNQ